METLCTLSLETLYHYSCPFWLHSCWTSYWSTEKYWRQWK